MQDLIKQLEELTLSPFKQDYEEVCRQMRNSVIDVEKEHQKNMNSLCDDLGKTIIDKKAHILKKKLEEKYNKRIDNLCDKFTNLVVEKKVSVNELADEFSRLELRTNKKIDQKMWGIFRALMMKPHCRPIINCTTSFYVRA